MLINWKKINQSKEKIELLNLNIKKCNTKINNLKSQRIRLKKKRKDLRNCWVIK